VSKTSIEWTEQTWNPVRGCSPVSPGCKNCYAERQAARFCGKGKPFEGFVQIKADGPHWTGHVGLIPEMLDVPLRRKKPTTYFVNSMSDLFHENLPDEAIDRVFAVMALCPQHTFQVLTKRAKRMQSYCSAVTFERLRDWMNRAADGGEHRVGGYSLTSIAHHTKRGTEFQFRRSSRPPLPNVWLGVSVEDQQRADERIPYLLQTPAAVRFVSAEPLLGPVDLRNLTVDMADTITQLVAMRQERGEVVTEESIGNYPLAMPLDSLTGLNPCGDQMGSLDWVIVGGESGPNARPFNIKWARRTVAYCKAAGVPCFVKQLGAHAIKDASGMSMHLEHSKGGDMAEWPEDLRVREMPKCAALPSS